MLHGSKIGKDQKKAIRTIEALEKLIRGFAED